MLIAIFIASFSALAVVVFMAWNMPYQNNDYRKEIDSEPEAKPIKVYKDYYNNPSDYYYVLAHSIEDTTLKDVR